VSKSNKTNAMRMLDRAKVEYETREYEFDPKHLSGIELAKKNNLPVKQLYKTILVKGNRTGYLVACLEADREIDLKKVAKLSSNKSVELVHVNDLEKITGYIRGGCSPIGMKKKFPTFADTSILKHEKIFISGGRRGLQIVISPKKLIDFCQITIGDITLD